MNHLILILFHVSKIVYINIFFGHGKINFTLATFIQEEYIIILHHTKSSWKFNDLVNNWNDVNSQSFIKFGGLLVLYNFYVTRIFTNSLVKP